MNVLATLHAMLSYVSYCKSKLTYFAVKLTVKKPLCFVPLGNKLEWFFVLFEYVIMRVEIRRVQLESRVSMLSHEERLAALERTMLPRVEFINAMNKFTLQQAQDASNTSHELTMLLGMVDSQNKDIRTIKEDASTIKETLNGHTSTLSEHTSMLYGHTFTLNSHTSMLNEHTTLLNEHTALLNSHTSMLNEHTTLLNRHTALLNGHTSTLNEHTALLKEQTSLLIQILARLPEKL